MCQRPNDVGIRTFSLLRNSTHPTAQFPTQPVRSNKNQRGANFDDWSSFDEKTVEMDSDIPDKKDWREMHGELQAARPRPKTETNRTHTDYTKEDRQDTLLGT